MKIYNTMSKRKEEFVPLEEGKVKMYVCGPTVYNYIHIGNARPMIVFDTVRRYFEYKNYAVNYVSNFTDVDDKIIKISDRGIGMTAEEIDKYINQIAFSGAEEFVEKYINFFSIGLSNILLTFDINNIIISGNLAKYIEKYQQDILKNIQKNIFFKNYPLNILCSNLNERSSILGAALIPISDFFNL